MGKGVVYILGFGLLALDTALTDNILHYSTQLYIDSLGRNVFVFRLLFRVLFQFPRTIKQLRNTNTHAPKSSLSFCFRKFWFCNETNMQTWVAHPNVHLWALFNMCLCPFWVCPGRQLWSGPGEWTPEALSTNSRFGIRAWHSRGIGTQIFQDEIMSWEWALKFPTLKLWVGFCPNQFLKIENLSAHSHLRCPFSTICVPVPGSANHEWETENLCWAPLASILQDPIRAVDLDMPTAQFTVEGGKTYILDFGLFWMFGFFNSFPGAQECHNRIQLNKICLNVVSNLKFANSKAHSWPRVGPVTQAHIVRLNTYSDALGRNLVCCARVVKVLFDFIKSTSKPSKQIFIHWNPRILSGFESLCVFDFSTVGVPNTNSKPRICDERLWRPFSRTSPELSTWT
jgi:hypothetical protein